MNLQISSAILILFVYEVVSQAGDSCTTKTGRPGTCTNIRRCPSAIEDIKRRINPQICGFEGADPVVCCAESSQQGGTATTSTQRPTSTTISNVDYTYVDSQSDCEPLSPERTSPKTGRKAWDKCIDYQSKYVFPCVKGPALTGEMVRVDRCGHGADGLIIGGEDTTPREYPHMVLLGFGPDIGTANWLCGGSIISEWYILTAGHCTYSREYGDVTFARLGVHKRTDQVDPARLYSIKSIIKHPDYKPPMKYNDVALLRTDREMKLDQYAVPGCLHIENPPLVPKVSATGWGSVQYKGPLANTMQKVTLDKFPTSECQVHFPQSRHMPTGFNDTTQLCYGSKVKSVDTCQGDSGGPLQIKSKSMECMYTIVGITSFGKACGFVGDPGMYTRVSAFTPWIESVVWP